MAVILSRRLLIAASGLLVALGGYASVLEAAPLFTTGPTANSQFEAWLEGRAASGLSLSSHVTLMNSCVLALTSAYGRAQPTRHRLRVARACADYAKSATGSSPSFAYGWYVLALTSSIRAEWDTMNRAIQAAQVTAPTEQWLTELRVALAEDNFDRLEAAVARGQELDLALLVRSARGISSIAKRYVVDQAFRARITDIVEKLDPASQRAFIDAVRAAAG